MAKLKELPINWLSEAWDFSEVLGRLPADAQYSKLNRLAALLFDGHIAPDDVNEIKSLQELIAIHIGIYLSKRHGVSFLPDLGQQNQTGAKGKTRRLALSISAHSDPTTTMGIRVALDGCGINLGQSCKWAMLAHERLGQLLIDDYVCEEWKRELPLIVAAIGGESVSRSAQRSATQPRPGRKRRKSELQQAKEKMAKQHPGESWKELLTRLEGAGIVKWDENDQQIVWKDLHGQRQEASTRTFKNWKTS